MSTTATAVASESFSNDYLIDQGRELLTVFHMTSLTDERVRDLHATAAELRSARGVHRAISGLPAIRMWAGTTLMALGEALVSGVQPVKAGRAVR